MSCTFSKLYWMFKCSLTASTCSREAIKLGSLNQNIENVLMINKCLGSTSEVTIVKLLLNRLTPCIIPQDCVSGLDICKGHLDKYTTKSLFFKRTLCEVQDCDNKASTRRVTLEMSNQIFHSLKQHAPIGAGEHYRIEYIC
jgi:hypothetical protein